MITTEQVLERCEQVKGKLAYIAGWLNLNVNIEINTDYDPQIDMDGLYITPEVKLVQSLNGEVPAIVWHIMAYEHIPGRFNPYDGGDPPDTVEKDLHDNIDNESDVIRLAIAAWVTKDIDDILMGKEMDEQREQLEALDAKEEDEALRNSCC